ncbi:hypothetical protein BHE74_00048370 [Ensete ventricosum]|nr:hypothetical protein BHE74_00048370 [Ensete ventricosum]
MLGRSSVEAAASSDDRTRRRPHTEVAASSDGRTRRQTHQAATARGGSRVQQRPRKRPPRTGAAMRWRPHRLWSCRSHAVVGGKGKRS